MRGGLTDCGQIRSFPLPEGWTELTVDRPPFSLATARIFSPPKGESARLTFYYRGGPVSESQAANFTSLLSQPPHRLSDEELWSVQQVLRDAALPGVFKPARAATEDLQGKRVLVLRGYWPQSGLESFTVYIDAGGGAQVQEICFAAPRADFAKHWPAVKQALRHTRWV